MGVAQLTLSCDRSFIANLCFIGLFSNSSIWRAHRGAGVPNAGFSVSHQRACAESNARRNLPSHRDHPSRERERERERGGSGRGTRLVLAAPIGRQYIKAGSVSDPDHGRGLHAPPIGERRSGASSPPSRDFVAWPTHKPSKSQGIRRTGICRLRLAPASGISALPELWPSG